MEQTNLESAVYALLLGLGFKMRDRVYWTDLQEAATLDQALGDEQASSYNRKDSEELLFRRRALYVVPNSPILGIEYIVANPIATKRIEGEFLISEIIRKRRYDMESVFVYRFTTSPDPMGIDYQDWVDLGSVVLCVDMQIGDFVHLEFVHKHFSYGSKDEIRGKIFIGTNDLVDENEEREEYDGNGTTETVIAGLHYLFTNAEQILQ